MKLWFASNNKNKREELEAVLGMKLMIPAENGIEFNPEENGTTFFENALIKARELKKQAGDGEFVIADDSGLCVDALGGKPGVNSAYYGDKNDIKLSCREKNTLLMNELAGNPARSAYFVCTMVLLLDKDRFFMVQETLEGKIVEHFDDIKGEGGFGYDPVFLIPSLGRTLAELSAEEKNSISHRGKAGRIIAEVLKTLNRFA